MKVKCQNCWKIFEVADDAVGKQKICQYCQRPMTIRMNAENFTSGTFNSSDDKLKSLNKKIQTLQIFILILVIFAILNLIFILMALHRSSVEENTMLVNQIANQQKEILKQLKENEALQQQQLANMESLFKKYNEDILKQTKKEFNNLNIQLAQIVREADSKVLLEAITSKLDGITSRLEQVNATLQKLQPDKKKQP